MKIERIYRDTQRQQVAINRLRNRGLSKEDAFERVVGRKPTLKQEFADYLRQMELDRKA